MNTEIKVTKYTKADKVELAYYDAAWDGYSSEGCYDNAIEAAHELGGIEIFNSNDNGSKSFAPTIEFKFDDDSTVQISYGSVDVIQ